MRAKIAGLPTAVRMMLGLMTVGIFLIVGLSMLENRPAVAWALVALATLRLVTWIRTLVRLQARRQALLEDQPPPVEPAPWPEDEEGWEAP